MIECSLRSSCALPASTHCFCRRDAAPLSLPSIAGAPSVAMRMDTRRCRSTPAEARQPMVASQMSFPVVPRSGTKLRNSSTMVKDAVIPRMKTASCAVSFVSMLSLRAMETNSKEEQVWDRFFHTLSAMSSILRVTVRADKHNPSILFRL